MMKIRNRVLGKQDPTSSEPNIVTGGGSSEEGTTVPGATKSFRERSRSSTSPPALAEDRKTLCRTLTQPDGTFEYLVLSTDTLSGLAARFDCTPSELCKLNKLINRHIFTGQILYIPKKSTYNKYGSTPPNTPNLTSVSESPNQFSPKPGHAKRINPHLNEESLSKEDNCHIKLNKQSQKVQIDPADRECLERFLKINARHITDGQGVVSGVLLVTPNALMFDPNVSDPLVIDRGAEYYGVTVPMDLICKAAMYSDIAHMRLKNSDANTCASKPEVYYACGTNSEDSLLKTSGFETKNILQSAEENTSIEEEENVFDNELKNESLGTDESNNTIEKGDEDDEKLLSEISDQHNCHQQFESSKLVINSEKETEVVENIESKNVPIKSLDNIIDDSSKEDDQDKMTDLKNSNLLEPTTLPLSRSIPEGYLFSKIENSQDFPSTVPIPSNNVQRKTSTAETRREQMLKRLSYPLGSLGEYTKSGINKVLGAPKSVAEFSSNLVFGAKQALSTEESDDTSSNLNVFRRAHSCSPTAKEFRNEMVDMADKKMDIFANYEKLIPKPARPNDDSPLYLCLRMGRPANKRWKKFSPAISSFGKKKIGREYWFSIPKPKADGLFYFFKRWASDIYGDVDDLNNLEERGIVPIDTDDEEDDSYDICDPTIQMKADIDNDNDNFDKIRKTKFWKLKKRNPLNFLKFVENHLHSDSNSRAVIHEPNIELNEIPIPDLIGVSEILNLSMRTSLCQHLPARAEGYPWTLVYSTLNHGFSLKTMYRCMEKFETPILLIVQDTLGNVFGALTSCSLRCSEHFYGTGETFLFIYKPDNSEFLCFPWTGENLYFIKGNIDSIAFGAGDGNFGLWLDGDLFHGRSQPCLTFGNVMLSEQEDFVVKSLECWGFV